MSIRIQRIIFSLVFVSTIISFAGAILSALQAPRIGVTAIHLAVKLFLVGLVEVVLLLLLIRLMTKLSREKNEKEKHKKAT